jgi:16S rRNA processing protein RimM
MELKCIGTITKPQGLKGEFRLKPNVRSFRDYKEIKKIIINNTEYIVNRVVLRDSFTIFNVQNIDSIDIAETLRNTDVYVEYDPENEPEDESIEGYKLVGKDGSTILGTITTVDNFGASDIVNVITDDGASFAFPNVREVITSIDDDLEIVYIDDDILDELRV